MRIANKAKQGKAKVTPYYTTTNDEPPWLVVFSSASSTTLPPHNRRFYRAIDMRRNTATPDTTPCANGVLQHFIRLPRRAVKLPF